MSKGIGIIEVPWKPTKLMLRAAAKAMSPGRRPTQDWMTVNQKHKVRYQAMVAAYLKEQEMGVKHTVELTRQEAERKACELVWGDRAYMFVNEVMTISDDDLCDMLEILNDSHHDGEGLENYRITAGPLTQA